MLATRNPVAAPVACFHEADPTLPLLRRSLAEGVGTMLLMFVVASTAAVPQTAPVAVLAAPGALVALVVALGAVSGGYFNPLITAMRWLAGERPVRCLIAYCLAQLAGSAIGAELAGTTAGGAQAPNPEAIKCRSSRPSCSARAA